MRAPFVVRLLFVGLFVVVTSSLLMPRAAAAGEYTITEIGTLVGTGDGQFDVLTNTDAVAINAEGLVAARGTSPDTDNSWSVAYTSLDGKVKRLGKEKANSAATDINDAGDLCGIVAALGDSLTSEGRPVVWRDGELIELEMLGGDIGSSLGLNQAGDVVGFTTLEPGTFFDSPYHAVLWQGDEVIDLGTLGGASSTAQDINNSGVIVGSSGTEGDESAHPFLWESSEMTQLEAPDGGYGGATAINDDGVIIGFTSKDSGIFAARWVDGKYEQLPAFVDEGQGNPRDINAAGLVVGFSSIDPAEVDNRAALWEADTITDLNDVIPDDTGFTLTAASGINDAGQIVAVGRSSEDEEVRQGFVLNPVDASAAQIGVALAGVPAAALRPTPK